MTGAELVAGAALGAVTGVAAEEAIKPNGNGQVVANVTELAALITAVSELARIMDYTRPLPPSYMTMEISADGSGDGIATFPTLPVPFFLERLAFSATTPATAPDVYAYLDATEPANLVGAANPGIGADSIGFDPPVFVPNSSPLIVVIDGAAANARVGLRAQYRVIPQHLYARLQSIEATR